MSLIQAEILNPPPIHASFLRFSLIDCELLPNCLKQLVSVYQAADSLIGFGPQILQRCQVEISGFKAAATIEGPLRTCPANQDDLWLRVSGDDPGQVMLRVQQFLEVLSPTFSLNQQIAGFKHKEGRDLSGYVDGTENPEDQAEQVVGLQGAAGVMGSSIVAVQKWQHQLQHMAKMSEAKQDDLIGRRKSDNVEFPDSPASAHVKRTAQESFSPEAFLLRRSLPWAEQGECGLYFVAFAASLYPFEAQLKRMLGCEDGIEDGLFQFSRPLSTAYYWCPPLTAKQDLDLQALGI